MRIVMISGILTPKEMQWDEMRRAFRRYLPDATFSVATEPDCPIWEIDRFRAFTLKTAATIDTGEDLLLVGHSLGGVLACAIQPLLQDSRVVGIATIHSPHRFLFGVFSKILFAEDVSAPIVSFQGLHDGLVWWGAKHPKSVVHVRNHANHFHDLWEHEENADLIARTTTRVFLKT